MDYYILKNELNICPYTWAVDGNIKSYALMTFDLELVPIDTKINRLRLWPTKIQNTNSPGLDMPEISGTQTHR